VFPNYNSSISIKLQNPTQSNICSTSFFYNADQTAHRAKLKNVCQYRHSKDPANTTNRASLPPAEAVTTGTGLCVAEPLGLVAECQRESGRSGVAGGQKLADAGFIDGGWGGGVIDGASDFGIQICGWGAAVHCGAFC
jgi:hypothetical protein